MHILCAVAASFEALISKARARAGQRQQVAPVEPPPTAQPEPAAPSPHASAGTSACQQPHGRDAAGAEPPGRLAAEPQSLLAAGEEGGGVQPEPGMAGSASAGRAACAGRLSEALDARGHRGQPPGLEQDAGGKSDRGDDVSGGEGAGLAEDAAGKDLGIMLDDCLDHVSDSEPDLDAG